VANVRQQFRCVSDVVQILRSPRHVADCCCVHSHALPFLEPPRPTLRVETAWPRQQSMAAEKQQQATSMPSRPNKVSSFERAARRRRAASRSAALSAVVDDVRSQSIWSASSVARWHRRSTPATRTLRSSWRAISSPHRSSSGTQRDGTEQSGMHCAWQAVLPFGAQAGNSSKPISSVGSPPSGLVWMPRCAWPRGDRTTSSRSR
jgi:hypothetical protein